MSFVSPVFLLFLPAVVLIHRITPGRFRWIPLLAASLLFYAWHNIWLLGLILLTVSVTYLCARLIEESDTRKEKKQAAAFSAVVCLGTLFLFKYLDFAVESTVSLANLFGAQLSYSSLHILLPMGISFYTFQTLSYVFDVYRGSVRAERHFGYYALFVTFFPQLVAGPIERPADLLPQLKNAPTGSRSDLLAALPLLIRGYGKKVLIADFLAIYVDNAYDHIATAGGLALALATVLFAVQIYCDFSGYCDIAQGCARLMGIRLTDNFQTPYVATSIREFWRRWHISLSRWFTDYLYIPLGGSRKGLVRTCVNTLIVFLVSGLWHGARWNFVIWGAIHGIYLIAERLLLKKKAPGRILTFSAVCFSWIFFRCQHLSDAIAVLSSIFSVWDFSTLLPGLDMSVPALAVCAMLIMLLRYLERLPRLSGTQSPALLWHNTLLYYLTFAAIVICRFLVLTDYGETAFIYFQF